jgi:hypothetical protein
MSSKTIVPEITKQKLSDFIIDVAYSGRTEKEITENAKSLAPAIKSADGWDMTQPGAFFTRDGKKFLARGFTRHAATQLAGFKDGYFVEIPDDPAKLRTEAIRSNMGKPISAYEQGRIYAAMRDGTDTENAKAGDIVLGAMDIKDIAEEVGYTRPHIENCICIFESSPEIGEMLAEGKVSAGIVVRSRQLVKDEKKQLAFLRAAYALAKKEGKECATKQHLDAVRADFAPIKAAKTGPEKTTPAKPEKTDGENGGENEDKGQGSGNTSQEQPELNALGKGATEDPKPSKPAATKVTKEMLVTVIIKWGEKQGVNMADEDIDALIDDLRELAIPF